MGGGHQRRCFCSAINVSAEVKNRLGISVNSLGVAGCLDAATLKGASWENVLLEMWYFLLVSVGCHTGTALDESVGLRLVVLVCCIYTAALLL